MDHDTGTTLCSNCNREIPTANFMIHSAHCARNITICQRCKEPVPVAEMKRHTEVVNCKQCGETMQACDVASHVTDACSQTPVQCQYCELLLCRQLMADHELYCGTRTERCPECHEHVMIKYKRLHEDSNHGFIKLDDEPDSLPLWGDMSNRFNLLSDVRPTEFTPFYHQKNIHRPGTTVKVKEKYLPIPKSVSSAYQSSSSNLNSVLPAKRTNDMPQINSVSPMTSSFSKDSQKNTFSSINAAKGAVKKYTAPHPPNASQPSTSFSSNSNSSNEKMTNMERSTNRTYCDITDPSRSSDINYSQNLRDNDESDRKVSNKFTFTPMTPDELAARLNKNNVREMTNNQQTTSYNNDIYPDHHYESIDYSHWSPPTRNTVPVQSAPPIDRFSDIKNELRVLRRELKDCSSPLENRRTSNTNLITPRPTNGLVNLYDNGEMVVDSPVIQRSNIEGLSDQLAKITVNPQPIKFPEVIHCNLCDHLVPLTEIQSHEEICGHNRENRANIPKKSTSHSHSKKKKSHKKPKAPVVPQYSSSNDDMSSFMLPCEFCQNMIPASLLVEHETSCCLIEHSNTNNRQNAAPPNTPEGSSGSRHSLTQSVNIIDNNFENMEEARGIYDIEQDEVMLPCEFCMMPIVASELMRHQESCYND